MSFKQIVFALLTFLVLHTETFGIDKENENSRKGKLLSLFSIVQFKNDPCRSTASFPSATGAVTFRNGTCFTATECTNAGGRAQGNCAAGFGVCCLFILSTSDSTTVNQNCTYIQNPGFPTPYTDGDSISYDINKFCDDVCYLRLDFETFNLLGPADTLEDDGGACSSDSFTVTTGTNQQIPTICGINTGQHIYVDVGLDSGDDATLNFNLQGTFNNRLWDIKVTQVSCNSITSPPDGCLQYSTGLTGRLTTFNFNAENSNHLASQDYSACIRQEAGYCCIQYQVCPDVTDGFSLSPDGRPLQDESCIGKDHIGIRDSSAICDQTNTATGLDSLYCGSMLSNSPQSFINTPVCDCTAPFIVDVFTNGRPDKNRGNNDLSRGVCLDWTQIPCTG